MRIVKEVYMFDKDTIYSLANVQIFRFGTSIEMQPFELLRIYSFAKLVVKISKIISDISQMAHCVSTTSIYFQKKRFRPKSF